MSNLSQLRKLIREQLHRLIESKCSACGDPNAYIGAGTVCECPNPQCRFFTQRQYDDIQATVSHAGSQPSVKNPIIVYKIGPDPSGHDIYAVNVVKYFGSLPQIGNVEISELYSTTCIELNSGEFYHRQLSNVILDYKDDYGSTHVCIDNNHWPIDVFIKKVWPII